MKKSVIVFVLVLLFSNGVYSEAVFHTQNIFPNVDKHVHASSIVECPNGDLLACWFHGSGERWADDVVIQGSRLKKGDIEWGPVFLMADTPGFPDCNPVLYVDRLERLWLFWTAVQANRWECGLLKYRRADEYECDGPPKWSWQDVIGLKPGEEFHDTIQQKFEEIGYEEGTWAEYAKPYAELLLEAAKDPYKRQTGWMPRIHPIALPSGRILLPLYSDGFNLSLIAISDDDGETWRASLPIVGSGPQQPSLVRREDGAIVAFLRDTGDLPYRIQISTSTDEGETWSAASDLEIPNPDSSLEVLPLRDGHWLLICNDTEDNRKQLTAYLSEDEGETWKWKRQLEPSDDVGRTFSYPSVIQTQDGLVHMTYSIATKGGASIRHCVINQEWVMEIQGQTTNYDGLQH